MSRITKSIAFSAAGFCAPLAAASDWYVDVGFAGCASGDGSQGNPFCRISDAVAAASGGDTIHVASGTYAEHVVLDRDLQLVGTAGRDVTIVDGTQSGRPLTVKSGVSAAVEGLTFTNGIEFPGSGVLVEDQASFTLIRSAVFRNGNAGDPTFGGGGVAILDSATATLIDSLIEQNAAVYEGGGIWIGNFAVVSLTRCGVNANWSGFDDFGGVGAGIFNGGGTLVIDGSSICHNHANRFGSSASGGGIYSSGGVLTIANSTICGNSAFSYYSNTSGGGVHVDTAGAHFEDVEISGNAVDSGQSVGLGAGLFCGQLTTIDRSTIAGNSAYAGGGVFVASTATATFGHTILAGNASSAGSSPDCDGVLTSAAYNLVGDTTGCVVGGDPTGNQLDVDPQFRDPANGDFRLAVGSPAIEAGDPALLPAGADAAGQPRVLDGDLDRAMRIDLGGHEFSHVRLVVIGDPIPGGTVTLDSSGTTGLALFLLVGTAPADDPFRPFGRLFLSIASPWVIVPFGTLPSSQLMNVPTGLPSGLLVILQELAFDAPSRAGSLSNAVDLRIE